MIIATVTIIILAVFAVLVLIAGLKGFFKGATEEIQRQHGVLRRLWSTFKLNLRKRKEDSQER